MDRSSAQHRIGTRGGRSTAADGRAALGCGQEAQAGRRTVAAVLAAAALTAAPASGADPEIRTWVGDPDGSDAPWWDHANWAESVSPTYLNIAYFGPAAQSPSKIDGYVYATVGGIHLGDTSHLGASPVLVFDHWLELLGGIRSVTTGPQTWVFGGFGDIILWDYITGDAVAFEIGEQQTLTVEPWLYAADGLLLLGEGDYIFRGVIHSYGLNKAGFTLDTSGRVRLENRILFGSGVSVLRGTLEIAHADALSSVGGLSIGGAGETVTIRDDVDGMLVIDTEDADGIDLQGHVRFEGDGGIRFEDDATIAGATAIANHVTGGGVAFMGKVTNPGHDLAIDGASTAATGFQAYAVEGDHTLDVGAPLVIGHIEFAAADRVLTLADAGRTGTLLYQGDDAIDATLRIDVNGAVLGGDLHVTGELALLGGTVEMGGDNTIDGLLRVDGSDVTMSGANTIESAGEIEVYGGALLLTGDNAIDGQIIAYGGTAELAGDNRAGHGTVGAVGGTLTLSGVHAAPSGTVGVSTGGTIVLEADAIKDHVNLFVTTMGGGTLRNLSGATAVIDPGSTQLYADLRLEGAPIVFAGAVDVRGPLAITSEISAGAGFEGAIANDGGHDLGIVGSGSLSLWGGYSFAGDHDLAVAIDGEAFIDGIVDAAGDSELRILTGGAGVLTLGGDNDIDGRLLLSGGVVVVSGDNSGSDGALTVDGADVTFASAAALFDGQGLSVSGHGSVLRFLDQPTLAQDIAAPGGVRFTFDTAGATLRHTGAIAVSGTGGGMRTIGAGVLELAGDYAGFDGELAAGGGTLRLLGDLPLAAVSVEHGAVLDGSAAIGSLSATGVVSPGGDAIGSFTLGEGDFTLGVTGVLDVQVAADGRSDRVVVERGDATLGSGGTIRVSRIAGESGKLEPGVVFAVIRTPEGAVSDLGVRVEDTATLDLEGRVADDGRSYILSIASIGDIGGGDTGGGPGGDAPGLLLDGAIGAAVNAMNGGGVRGQELFNAVALLDATRQQAFVTQTRRGGQASVVSVPSVAAAEATSFVTVNANYLAARRQEAPAAYRLAANTSVVSLRADPVAAAFENWDETVAAHEAAQRRWSAYAKSYGIFAGADESDDRVGYDASGVGAQAGIDYAFTDDLLAGLAVGYAYTDVDAEGADIRTTADTLRFGPYASWRRGRFAVVGSVSLGLHFYDVDRSTVVGSSSADFEAWDLTTYAGAGYTFELERLSITPEYSLQHTYFKRDGYTENGLDGLSYGGYDDHALLQRVGVRLRTTFSTDAATFTPELYAGWQHDYLNDTGSVAAAFAAGGSRFNIRAADTDQDQAYFGAGLAVELRNRLDLFARYEGQIGRDAHAHAVEVGVRLSF